MVSRFYRGKSYSLCLAKSINGEPYTFTRNAVFSKREKKTLVFTGNCSKYTVNLDTREVQYSNWAEGDNAKYTLCNIITGWSF